MLPDAVAQVDEREDALAAPPERVRTNLWTVLWGTLEAFPHQWDRALVLSLVWVIGSLPIITAPLAGCLCLWLVPQPRLRPRTYLAGLRAVWRAALGFTLWLSLVPAVLLLGNLVLVEAPRPELQFAYSLQQGLLLAFLWSQLYTPWYIARGQGTLAAMAASTRLALRAPLYATAAWAVLVLAALLLGVTVLGVFLFFGGFAALFLTDAGDNLLRPARAAHTT